MRALSRPSALVLSAALGALAALAACSGSDEPAPDGDDPDATDTDTEVGQPADPDPVTLRVATFNVSLYGDTAGEVAAQLDDPADPEGRTAAAILQTVRPDVVLLNEVDFDTDGPGGTSLAVTRLVEGFLAVAQDGREPLSYPHVFVAPVNTGVASGADLNGDGAVTTTPGSESYAADARGFGLYPGQYGMVVLSRYPIVASRTFQDLLWKDMPGALLPDDPATPEPGDFYSPEALAALPLSSKSHWDLSVEVDPELPPLHLLASHPTPPTFDGPEDRNGRRNHDEIRFWTDYIDGGADSWHVDDDGTAGGLTDEPFVILGDLNSDPFDGDSRHGAITALLDHPRTAEEPAPTSDGAGEQATAQGGLNASHSGPARRDTADFNDSTVGNLRIDYALPSANLAVQEAGVFWPASTDDGFDLVGTFPFPLTDHRLVWVDVTLGAPAGEDDAGGDDGDDG